MSVSVQRALIVSMMVAVAASPAAWAQQASPAYQTGFENPTPNWTLQGLWSFDGTPSGMPGGAVRSGSRSLNYNNGTNYSTGGANSGNAYSPFFQVNPNSAHVVRFWCNYQTETETLDYDQRSIEVYQGGSVVRTGNMRTSGSGNTPAAGFCSGMGTWHQHELDVPAIANPNATDAGLMRVVFSFSADSADNGFGGWFIDDLSVAPVSSAPGASALSAAPGSLAFSAIYFGSNPPAKTFTITNTGGQGLYWNASDDASWLSFYPSSGYLSSGGSATITAEVYSTTLSAGTHAAAIAFSANGATRVVNVALNVLPISASPAALSLSAANSGATTAAQSVTLENETSSSRSWSASTDRSWLNVTPNSGALFGFETGSVSVSVNAAGMSVGAYTGNVVITSGSSSLTLPVALTVTNAAAVVNVAPQVLAFTGFQGGSPSQPQTIVLYNTGNAPATWSATKSSWLTMSQTTGSLEAGGSQTVTVAANPLALSAQQYSGSIVVTPVTGGVAGQAKTVTVNFAVSPPTPGYSPNIAAVPNNVAFAVAQAGAAPGPKTFTIQNNGQGVLNWSATDSVDWMSFSPTSGSLPAGASQAVTVSANPVDMAVGTYTSAITISSLAAINSPVAVPVQMTIAPPAPNANPSIGVSAASKSFSWSIGATPPAAQTLSVQNSGTGTLWWKAASNASWLTVSPSSGQLGASATQQLTVSVNPSGLAANSYPAVLTLSGWGTNAKTVTVTLNVTGPTTPLLTVSEPSLAFTAKQNQNPAPTKQIILSNSGIGTLTWSAVDDAAWLEVSPSSGAIAAGTSQTVTVTAQPQNLALQTHSATIVLSAPGAGATTPKNIPVTFSVMKPCGLTGLEALLALGAAWAIRRRRR